MSTLTLKDRVRKLRQTLADFWGRQSPDQRKRLTVGLLFFPLLAVGVLVFMVLPFFRSAGPAGNLKREVVLYTSADDAVVRLVVDRFQSSTGITVKVVGDTEATKTFGLVARLLEEKDRPRADVWWASEPMGTVKLAQAGVLEPFANRNEKDIPGGWPAALKGSDLRWYGFAQRARVIAHHSTRVPRAMVPTKLRDLTQPRWRGKVGMAQPQFGTTRTHVAAIVVQAGPDAARAWLEALRDNGVKIYPGNASVVQAISVGEIELGLTDTDDVASAKRNGWAVDLVYETPDSARDLQRLKPGELKSFGPLVLPNTVSKVRGGPNPAPGAVLAEFLLSESVERDLASSESRNIPVRPSLQKQFSDLPVPSPAEVDFGSVAAAEAQAMQIIESVFGPAPQPGKP
ncbi:MAG: extracellular solute-binding protein [Planctomycetota bacterium]|nr:extracellular solute-binding protein [Planctomycetota bacterium]